MRKEECNIDPEMNGGPLWGKAFSTAYKTENVSLYQADFLDIASCIKDSSVDLVFTDPPFELVSGGMKRGKLNYSAGEVFKNSGFSTQNIQFDNWIPEIYRILQERRYFYVIIVISQQEARYRKVRALLLLSHLTS